MTEVFWEKKMGSVLFRCKFTVKVTFLGKNDNFGSKNAEIYNFQKIPSVIYHKLIHWEQVCKISGQ